ncbi:MAG: SMI1/KNR4 family protein [Bauldia sp.]|nr:SMI1/KNR4 family protein [Bauldia sp.]
MIGSATRLRERLIASGIARPEDIEGCPPAEIAAIEARHGLLPASYREILALIGHRAGRLVDDLEFRIYVDQLDAVNGDAQTLLQGCAEDHLASGVPANAFFISARYGENPCYLLTGEADDSAVHIFKSDDCRIELVHLSVWGWIDDFVRDAEHFIGLGLGGANARRG